jgi:hypothetical protein
MNKPFVGALKSLVILCIYLTLIIALAPVLHIIFLAGLLAWIVVRRPIAHTDRINTDVSAFAQKVGTVMGKAMETLIRPLV